MANTFKFGNMIWTTEELYSKINDTYLLSLDRNYKTGFSFLEKENPEKAINDWISETTNNKINKLYGKELFMAYIVASRLYCFLKTYDFDFL